ARVFSLKQTSVPIAGVIAGTLFPAVALGLRWEACALIVATASITAAVAVQPMRAAMDGDRRPEYRLELAELVEPLRLTVSNRSLLVLGAGAAWFSALQFCLTSLYVIFLVEAADVPMAKAGQGLAVATAASLVARP